MSGRRQKRRRRRAPTGVPRRSTSSISLASYGSWNARRPRRTARSHGGLRRRDRHGMLRWCTRSNESDAGSALLALGSRTTTTKSAAVSPPPPIRRSRSRRPTSPTRGETRRDPGETPSCRWPRPPSWWHPARPLRRPLHRPRQVGRQSPDRSHPHPGARTTPSDRVEYRSRRARRPGSDCPTRWPASHRPRWSRASSATVEPLRRPGETASQAVLGPG